MGSEATEYRSFLWVEEGSLSRTLAFNCGHGYTQEEHAMKREREKQTILLDCLMTEAQRVHVSGVPSMERELIERCVGRAPSVER